MEAKTSEWRPGPTVCRCCLTEGCYKDISTEYFWMGKREVYAEMLSDTLNVTIAYSQSGGPNSNSRLICEPCISRLRDASEFKRQVQECEKTFMQHLDPGTSSVIEIEAPVDIIGKEVKLERVKLESALSDDDDDFEERNDFATVDDDDDDDDLDDQPLTKLASKVPKKESVDLLDLFDNTKAAEKRKATIKLKMSPAKKAKPTKKEAPKPTASKTAKPEKKKKVDETLHIRMAKKNAEIVLQYSTVYPFRLLGKSLRCVFCYEQYDDPSDFRKHVDENHQKFTISTAFAHTAKGKDLLKVDCTNLRCRICGEPAENITQIAKHIKTLHCDKINLDYDVNMQPYKITRDNWTCFICNKKLPTITKLCRHTASHYHKHTCDVCGRGYLNVEALKYHIRCSHTGNNVCRKCWKDFPTAQQKKEHVQASKACWGFCCVHCRERFLSWEHKQTHLVEVHGAAKIDYNCPECSGKFETRKKFYNHYKIFHSDENFACSCCGLKFGSKKLLEDHRLGHTGEKHFECSVCYKTFSRSKSLVQHMWIHSESKRFACVVCEKQFAQKVSLKGHMKSHHPDVPYL